MKNNRNIANVFSANLQKLINHHSIPLRKLSKAIGIKHPYLSQLTNNHRSNPSIKVVKKISDVFQVTMAQLFGEQKIDFKKRPKKIDFDFEKK